MEFHEILSILLIFFSFYIYFESNSDESEYIKSKIDNREYLVQKLDDKQDAANLLAKINQNIIKLINHLKKIYPSDPRIIRLSNKFNPNNIIETGLNSSYTSYSVNKGEKVSLCLRSRDGKNKLTDLNTLMFVALHEVAHIMTLSIGHTKEFWTNFKFLLKEAIKIGIYKKVDYNTEPQKYCGIEVTDTPLNDTSL